MAEKKKETTKEVKLNPKVWGIAYNPDLLAQVLYVFSNNERKGTSAVKGRGEVSGGGRKPWRQKGTGRARHGSIRSPIWVGGGVAFGPNDRNWKRKINKKMVKKAVCIALSERNREGLVDVVEINNRNGLKTLRNKITKNIKEKALLISANEKIVLALRNVDGFKVIDPMKANLRDIVSAKKLLVDKEALDILEKRLTNGK